MFRLFWRGRNNQNTERKTESLLFSGFDNGTSHGYKRKSTTERFATGRLWPCTWKISSDSEDQVNKWEFCIFKKITPIVCFCSVSKHFFILSLSANALYDFYSEIVDPLFWVINKLKVYFSCQKRLLCLYDMRPGIKSKHYVSPWTPTSDQSRISLHIINAAAFWAVLMHGRYVFAPKNYR